VGKNQRQHKFYCDITVLDDHERIHLAKEMERSGAKRSGCLLLEAPFWLLAILALVICWLIYAVNTPPPILGSLVLGGFLLPTVYIATRKWVYRAYHREPVIIGT
jgi:Flp pilus assembly protein TadB